MSQSILGTTWTWDKWLSELGTSQDIPRCPKLWQSLVPSPSRIPWDISGIPRCFKVFLGLVGPGTSDCQSLGHPGICPRVFLVLLGPGTSDCQSLGHPGISWDVPGNERISRIYLDTWWQFCYAMNTCMMSSGYSCVARPTYVRLYWAVAHACV